MSIRRLLAAAAALVALAGGAVIQTGQAGEPTTAQARGAVQCDCDWFS